MLKKFASCLKWWIKGLLCGKGWGRFLNFRSKTVKLLTNKFLSLLFDHLSSSELRQISFLFDNTAHKNKFSVQIIFSKCEQTSRFPWICPCLLKIFLTGNFIFMWCNRLRTTFIVSATRRIRDIKIPLCLSAPVRKSLI